jgi:hypothetical protein
MNEYDIGDIVLHIDPKGIKTIGVICDKREDDGDIKYSIDWADGYRDDYYGHVQVTNYINNVTMLA